MPPETSKHLGEAVAIPPAATPPLPPTKIAAADGAAGEPVVTTSPGPSSSKRRVIIVAIAVAALAVVSYFGVPVVGRMLNTISTDDAYVNGHVTSVAAGVEPRTAHFQRVAHRLLMAVREPTRGQLGGPVRRPPAFIQAANDRPL